MSVKKPSRTNHPNQGGYHHPPLDGQDLKELVEAALNWLKTNQQTVNALNVFPVPDGDTGTNMVLTMQAALNEISNSGEKNIGKMAHLVAQGSLMGARGNSGVILSQIWRGFARALDNLETMDGHTFVAALVEGRGTAYKGVVRPVEGTILTVAKDIAIAAQEAEQINPDPVFILEKVVEAGDESVKKTPDLLPILKSAGVVDAGGKGLYYILEGMLRSVKGLPLDTPTTTVQPLAAINLEHAAEEIEPGQDYEVVIDFKPQVVLDLDRFYNELSHIGTSIQVGEGDGIYRMHIHVPTEKVHDPFDYVAKVGTVMKVSTENLRSQMAEVASAAAEKIKFVPFESGQIAVVAVSPGQGLSRIFASLGVNAIVEGGQTMNPSTEEILKSFENLPTDKIIILPNNKNILLAAQASTSLTVKKVAVIPSISIPQGLAAMLRLAPDGNLEDVVQQMTDALRDVDTGEITTATRSVKMNGVQVHEGEVIALLNGKLVYSAPTLEEACLGLLARANTASKERITLYYGKNISVHEVNVIKDKIQSVYPAQELEEHEGGQPYYQFIIAIE
ncbi:MAG: DAK2 domain-containing protein [Chloroflexi bacterium]|nr:DAK2 domain-containing protein [Chloroflexota bacterium]